MRGSVRVYDKMDHSNIKLRKHDGEIRVNVAFEVRSNEHNMNNFFSQPDIAWNILC